MSINTVLFDLDGTLLSLTQESFVNAYFSRLAKKLIPYGYDSEKLIKAIWDGTVLMVKNDGKRTNEEVFWDHFVSVFGKRSLEHTPVFDDFYRNEFDEVKEVCSKNELAPKVIRVLKKKGKRIALATNPLFPPAATQARVRWAGLDASDFELITTYDNSHYCKPNPDYYVEILAKLGVNADECLMVGNDVGEDMIAQRLGMSVFLLTNDLINKNNTDISVYPHGDFNALIRFIENI
ncbi:MAG: HAD family hydrolase [Clostridia bacterium]|nr:HAD family hydrolase [Clostridia bacterium]